MMNIPLPERFQAPLRESHRYPRNAISSTVDNLPYALGALGDKLDSIKPTLFESDESQWEVVIRDFFPADGRAVAKCNAHHLSELSDFLGIERDTSSRPELIQAKKKYPKCRFILPASIIKLKSLSRNLYAVSSRAPLLLTPEMFGELMTYHQVMPNIVDFISLFGEKSQPNDLIFSGFSAQPIMTKPVSGRAVDGLGRSGKQYQLCYNLKCANMKMKHPTDFTSDEWSIHQAVIHHQFDVVGGETLWLVVKRGMDLELQKRFKDLMSDKSPSEYRSFGDPEESFRSSLSAHLMYCLWAREGWRGYIGWLERLADQESVRGIDKEYTPPDIQNIQICEEAAGLAIAALEGNIDVISAMLEFYRSAVKDRNFTVKGDCAGEVALFATQVKSINVQFAMEVKRAQALVKCISARRELVIQHLQNQSASRMEKLSHRMEQEQNMMLIITTVTLIYLPATFVSTFFSTDIIKYQGTDSPGGSYSETAMTRWLQITIPLTVLTGLGAWFGRKALQRGWEHENQVPYTGSFPPADSQDWLGRIKQLFVPPRSLLP
ncbi:hypothetical protein PG993_007393 [Apiospora rasikravindrae]|uniref:CorA-like transporter domain-containing protein n=1 Tax=Apiospora rasikravindrae TaxID=990691 RepID=A0ABR1SXE1_9PEZI